MDVQKRGGGDQGGHRARAQGGAAGGRQSARLVTDPLVIDPLVIDPEGGAAGGGSPRGWQPGECTPAPQDGKGRAPPRALQDPGTPLQPPPPTPSTLAQPLSPLSLLFPPPLPMGATAPPPSRHTRHPRPSLTFLSPADGGGGTTPVRCRPALRRPTCSPGGDPRCGEAPSPPGDPGRPPDDDDAPSVEAAPWAAAVPAAHSGTGSSKRPYDAIRACERLRLAAGCERVKRQGVGGGGGAVHRRRAGGQRGLGAKG